LVLLECPLSKPDRVPAMTRSMTAFDRQQHQAEWGRISWELRSVNHRYLDVQPRLPEELRHLEPAVRERIGARLGRGKVECTLRFKPAAGYAGRLTIDEGYAEQVIEAARALGQRVGADPAGTGLDLLKVPGVVQESDPDLEPVAEAALALLDRCLDGFEAAREREGERLAQVLRDRAAGVTELVDQVRARRQAVNHKVREKFLARLESLDVEADEGRLEQELAIIAQKLDVDEELERLQAHCAELADALQRSEPIGRRLDFLMQEFNREANTLSSKSNDTETTRAAVEMKVLIEQMREQVQNIE